MVLSETVGEQTHLVIIISDIGKIWVMNKLYHYIFYCYYSLVSGKADHREDGASNLLTVLMASILISIYYYLNMILEREYFIPALEGFGIFFVGLFLWYLNRGYFVKRKNYQLAIDEFSHIPKFLTLLVGSLLLVLPFALFAFTGIKMGNYIRSIR